MTQAISILLAATVSFVAIGYTNHEPAGRDALQKDVASSSQASVSNLEQRKAIPPITDEERKKSSKTWLYIAGLQTYVVNVVDPMSGHALHEIPLMAQSPGVAVAPDGSRLYIVDGQRDGQLLVFDTATWEVIYREPVTHRAELIGGNPVSLSGDGRWLLAQHYNYNNGRRWTSVFDTRSLQFRPEGASVLQIPEGFRFMRMAGRPGHPRLYADYRDSVWLSIARTSHRSGEPLLL